MRYPRPLKHTALPMQTDVETFNKATVTRSFVERQMKANLAAGAVASEITETPTNWVLTTVWPD